ncbi:MAG TPA: ATP-binding cassette domain-containing protein [Planctomycetota bacterium]|nr:ATP-binding cassette domain-containing protein [Planctomycetota bacterium]
MEGVGRVIIRVEGLRKSFGDQEVLRGVDFDIRRGEFLAIVGPSGAGKTVLLEILIRNLKPDGGRILVIHPDDPDGDLVDMAGLDEQTFGKLLAETAIVFQQDALYSASVFENIALMPRETLGLDEEEIRRRVKEALEAVDLPATPEMLNLHRDELSGGMRKRVAIARALAVRPRAIVYDDPTAGLDPARASMIHDLIGRAHAQFGTRGRSQTTMVVTHDKDLLRRFKPRVIMLSDGRVRFDGPWEEFESSEDPLIRPYVSEMPRLHLRQRA